MKALALQQEYNLENIVSLHKNLCSAYDTNIHLDKPRIQYRRVVLVVLFNNPMQNLIPILELLYRPFFPHMVYCMAEPELRPELRKWNVTIVTYDSPHGEKNYICAHYVNLLGLEADGFLFIADDTLVPPGIISDLSMSLPATVNTLPKACSIAAPYKKCRRWTHFDYGAIALKSLWDENKHEFKNSLVNHCKHSLQNMTRLLDPFVYDSADVYFIPASFMPAASQLFMKLYKHNVFLEVAVNSVLACLSWPKLPTKLIGDQEWGRDRDKWYKFLPSFISKKKMFLHPAKYSFVLKGDKEYVEAFCQIILPYFHRKPKE